MTRIEQDETASDDLLKSWTSEDEEPRVIRSHRAPRTWLRQHAGAVTTLLAVCLGLGSAGAASIAEEPERATAAMGWTEPAAPAVAKDATIKIIEEPAQRRAQNALRASRSQERKQLTPRWVSPLFGKLKTTSCYGMRRGELHQGLDLDGETGDTVRSVGTGRVVQAGWRWSGSGYTIMVQYGSELVLYAHLSKTSVRAGAHVRAGQKIGEMGSTGNSTGSHLHIGVSRSKIVTQFWDRTVNPAGWLRAHGIAVPGC